MRVLGSVRARFTGWYLLVLAVLLVALSVGLCVFLSFTLHRDLDRVLVHRATQIAALRGFRENLAEGRFEEMVGEIIAVYTRDGNGYVVASTRNVEGVRADWIEEAFAGNRIRVTVNDANGEPLRAYIARLAPPGALRVPEDGPDAPPPAEEPADTSSGDAPPKPAVLLVAQPTKNITSALAALRTTLFVAVPLTLLLSAGGGLFLVRRALEPVDRMISATREIEGGDLSRRVEVRTSDELGRLGRTLNAMLDRLERAFRRQRQFTDDASHELRSPLSVIEAEATLALRRERAAEDYKRSLEVIADEAREMNRLIDQLLTLARSDAGKDGLEITRVDLAGIAQETVSALLPVASEKGVRLTPPAGEKLEIEGDGGKLRRVAANLVENAIRHTQAGGSVTVSVQRAGSEALLEVVDTGCGIPPEDLPHIFERFYRIGKARSREDGGAGLGLAICRAIVDAHGGTIETTSRMGEGTRFSVLLPVNLGSRAD